MERIVDEHLNEEQLNYGIKGKVYEVHSKFVGIIPKCANTNKTLHDLLIDINNPILK